VTRTESEERRICGHQAARDSPGDSVIVTSTFKGIDDDEGGILTPENQLWHFEQERRMREMMAHDSP
jgi:hypothetical protein